MHTITLYTRNHCPLCDKAKAAIIELQAQWKFQLEEIDIETSDELTERYGLMIPVVHLDGEEVGFGFVDKNDISNRLQEKNQIK
ncbi:glutaredoxin family protein [Neobacillus cucumis]|uniref:glutaredoxin family protein n=1 Tax=Neobacillus cucumis TaxID=1740721 RepID=UPI002041174B|nr:glutaredoxin family protein [Neobacillus cucumis]MCM3729392.1 glutaredoxin family protein [Neobacillus cucumis]